MTDWQPSHALQFLAELLGGQIGLVTPLVFAVCAAGIVAAARHTWRTRDPGWTLLAAMTLPSLALFTQHALGDRVQGNWPAIIWPAAAIAAGGLHSPVWRRLSPPAVALGLAITLLVYLEAIWAVLPLPVRDDPIARQIAGWDTLSAEIDAVLRQMGARFIAADQYGTAAQLARALPPDITMVGVEPRWALTDLPPARVTGQTGLLVQKPDCSQPSATQIATVTRRKGQDAIETYRLCQVVLKSGTHDAVILPRPQ